MQQRAFGDLEAVIMDRVWDRDEAVTVREVFDELSAERQIAYTTVLSTMDNLHRKNWLKRERSGKAAPAVPLSYAGQQNIFAGQIELKEAGDYVVDIYAYDPANGNTGVERVTLRAQ